MRSLPPALLLIATGLWGGCGGILSGDFFPNERRVGGTAAHLVYRAPLDCRAGVARTHNGKYLVYRVASDATPPREGQVLEGPARVGRSVFQVYRADHNRTWRAGRPVPLQVLKLDLSLEMAGAELRDACGGN